jgi:hypothetical protein
MRLFYIFLIVISALISCSKKEGVTTNPPITIPTKIEGLITELNVTPINITTPDKGSFVIFSNNTLYNVEFDAVEQSQSNADLLFGSDTLLIDESREFANFGNDIVAYNPLGINEIKINFKDGRKLTGTFDLSASFSGIFGEQLISQWRTVGDPGKPNQKAKDDLIGFIHRYADKDGPGPNSSPTSVFVEVSPH